MSQFSHERTNASFEELALHHSVASFLNSLQRECDQIDFIDSPEMIRTRTGLTTCLRFSPRNGECLLVPIETFSELGRHEYRARFFRETEMDLEEIPHDAFARALIFDLVTRNSLRHEQGEEFLRRYQDSIINIQTLLQLRAKDLKTLRLNEMSFLKAEQSLLLGHSFHPTPKSRSEFDADDFMSYSPETESSFAIHWFLVKPELCFQMKASSFKDDDFALSLFHDAYQERPASADVALAKGFQPYPVHPWQKNHLLARVDIQRSIANGEIIDCGPSVNLWSPTSSLRSLYSTHSRYMLKFSMSVRLTNSVRHLQPNEVIRGLQLTDVLATETGLRFLNENPQLSILREPAFMALRSTEGDLLPESIVVWRENPFAEGSVHDSAIVLATLIQDDPYRGESRISECIRKLREEQNLSLRSACTLWFDQFLLNVVYPLMRARSDYGILLGAHQQNLVIRLRDFLPVGAWFRDCQGTGYSLQGLQLFQKEVGLLDERNGNVLDSHRSDTLFVYYLFINSTFNVISALARTNPAVERELLALLRLRLQNWLDEKPNDPSCLELLLHSSSLLQKGNFFCSLTGLNENTTQNPLVIYRPMPNPIFTIETKPHPLGASDYESVID